MAVNDSVAQAFCNNQLRPICDKLAGLLIDAQILLAQYADGNLSGDFPNDSTPVLDNNTPVMPYVGSDVNNVIAVLQAFVAGAQANSGTVQNSIARISVNPRP